ncbi:TPA: hypothetical protein ACXG7W_003755, partial [Escherichia coli]
ESATVIFFIFLPFRLNFSVEKRSLRTNVYLFWIRVSSFANKNQGIFVIKITNNNLENPMDY